VFFDRDTQVLILLPM